MKTSSETEIYFFGLRYRGNLVYVWMAWVGHSPNAKVNIKSYRRHFKVLRASTKNLVEFLQSGENSTCGMTGSGVETFVSTIDSSSSLCNC